MNLSMEYSTSCCSLLLYRPLSLFDVGTGGGYHPSKRCRSIVGKFM